MKKFLLLSLIALFFSSIEISAQRGGNNILLKSGIIHSQNDFLQKIGEAIPSNDIFLGYYYRMVQFNVMPTQQQQKDIEASGIALTGYLPYATFYTAIPVNYDLAQLTPFNARTILRIGDRDKLSNELRNGNMPEHARRKSGTVDLVLQYYKNISSDVVQSQLVTKGCEILERINESQLITIRITEEKWSSLAALPYVKYLQPIAPPPVPDDTKGRSLHRSNAINTDFSGGRHWDGSGVSIALADDGIVGPHIDFTGRLTNLTTTPGGFHGDMTSGIAVGAGNLNPMYRGMATGAQLYVFDIGSYPQMVNMASNLATYQTVITSTSYSQGCNDYDTYSQSGDQSVHDIKVVQPVFSAGNNNGADCGYGAGTQWGNITGGYKEGKNVIACANLDATGVLDNTSSRGPAADGRIKPDISSNGKDQMSTDENNLYQVGGGTSAACPGVAGICAQLYQAYRTLTGNPNPEAPLIKACLLNSAEDIGVAGPDFIYGYGRVNSLRAVKTLEENRYLSDSVNQGQTKTHNIIVPAGTSSIKVMVLWLDQPGSATAAVALVNDLDITVTDPSATAFQPWVLDPTPNATTLNNPAVRSTDTLNNMEQVTIDAPVAGTYTVHVNGASVPLGPQKYYLVYEFWTDEVTLTYPFGGEGFVPGEQELLRWDAYGTSGTFKLEYSADSGSTWTVINSSISASLRQYTWTVPGIAASGRVFVRLTRGLYSDMNDAPLSIVNVPANLAVNYSCTDSLQLSWSVVTGATRYEVSKLGTNYMDSIATTTGTTVTLPVNSTIDTWFSVRAITTANGKGRRALAIHKAPGTINCALALDASAVIVQSPASGIQFPCSPLNAVLVTVQIRNEGISTLTGFDISYSLNGGPAVTETFSGSLVQAATMNYTFASTVDLSVLTNYSVVAKVILAGDMNSFNDSAVTTGIVGSSAVAPLTENFQAVTFPPTGWQSVNPDVDGFYWRQSASVTGSGGTPTLTSYIANYSNSVRGTIDYMITKLIDLSSLTMPLMTFDLAYGRYNDGFDDRMTIEVSTDCGGTFVPSGYDKASLELNTLPAVVNAFSFSPTAASQWRKDSVDLVPFAGQPVLIRFTDINDYGNNLFVDNINIDNNSTIGITEASQVPSIGVYPNPSFGLFNVSLENMTGKVIQVEVTDVQGRVVWEQNVTNSAKTLKTSFDLSKHAKGIYNLRITTEEKNYHMKITLM